MDARLKHLKGRIQQNLECLSMGETTVASLAQTNYFLIELLEYVEDLQTEVDELKQKL